MVYSTKNQQGAVLLVALVLLLILTVAGVSAMRISNVEERMTGNFNDRAIAVQVAEAMLVAAEEEINAAQFQPLNFWSECNAATTTCFKSDCKDGLCFSGTYSATASGNCILGTTTSPLDEVFQKSANWSDTNKHRTAKVNLGLDSTNAKIEIEGKYIIEFMCFVVQNPSSTDPLVANSNKYLATYWEPFYRITAMGFGRSNSTRVMLQTTFRRN